MRDDYHFRDMLNDCMDVYVDDIVLKSKKVCNHVDDLRKVSTACMLYKLRTNP